MPNSAPHHLIEDRVEDAIIAAIVDRVGGSYDGETGDLTGGTLDGWRLASGLSDVDLNHPRLVLVTVTESDPAETGIAKPTGNQEMKATIECQGHGDDVSRAELALAAGHVRDLVYDAGILDLLAATETPDLTVYRWFPGSVRRGAAEAFRAISIEANIKARPSREGI